MKNKFVFLLIFVISTLYSEDLSSMQKRNLKNAIYYLEKAEQAPSLSYTKNFFSYAERYANKLFAEIPEHEEVKKLKVRIDKVRNLVQAEEINRKLKRQTSFAENEVTSAEKGQYYSKDRLLQRITDMQKKLNLLKNVDKNKYQKEISKAEDMIRRASTALGLDKSAEEEKLKEKLEAKAKMNLELEAKLAKEKLELEAKAKRELEARAKRELEARAKRDLEAKVLEKKSTDKKNVKLSYRDKQSLKNVQIFLAQASRISYPDIIAKRIKQAEEQFLPLQQRYAQLAEVKSTAELLQKQKTRLSQLTTKEPETNNPPKVENSSENKQLSYQQLNNLKYANSRLKTVEKNIETLENHSKNPRMTKQYLEDYAAVARKNIRYANDELDALEKTHAGNSQAKELREKIKDFENQIEMILSSKSSEEIVGLQEIITKGTNAVNLLTQVCQAKFDDKKITELASSNRNNMRGNRYGSNSVGSFVRTKAQEILAAIHSVDLPQYRSKQMQKLIEDKGLVEKAAFVKKSFVALCDDVSNFSKEQFELAQTDLTSGKKRNEGPSVFIPAFKKFLELHKKPKFILFTFVGQVRDSSIESHCDEYKELAEKAEHYIQFLYKCDTIRNAREKALQSFRKENIAEAQEMVKGDSILQGLLDYYSVFGDKFNTVENSLKSLKQDLLTRIETASKKASLQGFAKFKSQYQEVTADRQAMLNSPQKYQGKIIANAEFRVASWNTKGWYLPHGNEMFSYVWDRALWKRFREMELEQFKIFRDFRQQIVDKHGLTLENQMDWRFPGLVDIEFVAIVDGTTSFTPVREIKDRYGKIIYTEKLPSIQVVNARVVGLKSRYFTLWLGGTDTNKHLNISGLPK